MDVKRARPNGQVRVAKYYPGKPLPAAPPGYTNVLIHTSPKDIGGPLSPYLLKDERGCLLENIWQFSKLYKIVQAQRIPLGRFHPDKIIWEHGAEMHVNPDETPNQAYWAWRDKGMHNPVAIRYPNGFQGRKKCIYSVLGTPEAFERLNYIEARKRIYCAEYARLAPQTDAFKKLRAMLEDGKHLQIIEVDGPDPNLDYGPYKDISRESPGMLMSEDTIRQLVADEHKPFGHGFVIAALLLDGAEWMQ